MMSSCEETQDTYASAVQAIDDAVKEKTGGKILTGEGIDTVRR